MQTLVGIALRGAKCLHLATARWGPGGWPTSDFWLTTHHSTNSLLASQKLLTRAIGSVKIMGVPNISHGEG
jgi:hypothetical protein